MSPEQFGRLRGDGTAIAKSRLVRGGESSLSSVDELITLATDIARRFDDRTALLALDVARKAVLSGGAR